MKQEPQQSQSDDQGQGEEEDRSEQVSVNCFADFEKWRSGGCQNCGFCSRLFATADSFWRHVQEDHDVSPDDYRRDGGLLSPGRVRCDLCCQSVPQDYLDMTAHFEDTHFIDLQEYFSQFFDGSSSVQVQENNVGTDDDEDDQAVVVGDYEQVDDAAERESSVNDATEGEGSEALILPRKSCPYAADCTRKNPAHRVEEAHPGDDDFRPVNLDDSESEEEEGLDRRPECEFWEECYRLNLAHFRDFKHPRGHRPSKRRRRSEDEDDGQDSSFWSGSEREADSDDDWTPA